MLGVGTKPGDLGLAFGLSALLPGIGDNLARGAKQLAGQGDNVIGAAIRQTGDMSLRY